MIEDKRLSKTLLKNHYEWCKKNGIALSVGMCKQPSYLSFASLPNEVRQQVKKALVEAEITIRQKTVGDEEEWPVEKIIDAIALTKFDPKEYKKFIEYVKWYEKGKKIGGGYCNHRTRFDWEDV